MREGRLEKGPPTASKGSRTERVERARAGGASAPWVEEQRRGKAVAGSVMIGGLEPVLEEATDVSLDGTVGGEV